MLQNFWPGSFSKLHPECQTLITEIFCCFFTKNSNSNFDDTFFLPLEIFEIIVEQLILVWPKTKNHQFYFPVVSAVRQPWPPQQTRAPVQIARGVTPVQVQAPQALNLPRFGANPQQQQQGQVPQIPAQLQRQHLQSVQNLLQLQIQIRQNIPQQNFPQNPQPQFPPKNQ